MPTYCLWLIMVLCRWQLQVDSKPWKFKAQSWPILGKNQLDCRVSAWLLSKNKATALFFGSKFKFAKTSRPPCLPSAWFSPTMTGLATSCFCSKCPAGTCDGCTFNFLWESASACPRCTEADYHEIEGACKGGAQVTNVPLFSFLKWMSCALSQGFSNSAWWQYVGVSDRCSLSIVTSCVPVLIRCFYWVFENQLPF